MKTIRFTYHNTPSCTGYKCSEPGDMSGLYVKAEVALSLLEHLKDLSETVDEEVPSHEFGQALRIALTDARRAIKLAEGTE